MRFCPSCGTMNEDDARFCENCGTKLEWEENINPENAGSQNITEEGNYDTDQENSPADDGYSDAGQETEQMYSAPQYEEQPVWEEQIPVQTPPEMVRKRKLSKLQTAVIAEAICLIAAVVIFFAVGNHKYSPDAVAERFFDAYATGDWAAAYSLLDVPEGDFLQESMFETLMEKVQFPDITNYSVQASGSSEGGLSRNYTAEYSVEGAGTAEMSFSLIRQSDKSMFFFNDWKVSIDGLLTDGYQITVPAGTQAAVDGVQLPDDYRISPDGSVSDVYQITLFSGTHTLTAAVPWCELYESDFNTTTESSLILTDVTPSAEGALAFQAKLQEMLETFYSSAASGADYSEIESLFATDNEVYSNLSADIESRYEELSESISPDPDDYYTFNQITFDNFRCELNVEQGMLMGSLYYDYTIGYSYSGFSSSGNDTVTGSNNSSSAIFVYDGETYKVIPNSLTNYIWWQ